VQQKRLILLGVIIFSTLQFTLGWSFFDTVLIFDASGVKIEYLLIVNYGANAVPVKKCWKKSAFFSTKLSTRGFHDPWRPTNHSKQAKTKIGKNTRKKTRNKSPSWGFSSYLLHKVILTADYRLRRRISFRHGRVRFSRCLPGANLGIQAQ